MAAEVGRVVVGIVRTVRVKLLMVVVRGAFAVHGPEESKDERHDPQHHTAEGEGLEPALVRGQEGSGAPGHDEESSDEDRSVVQRGHLTRGGARNLGVSHGEPSLTAPKL